MIYQVPKYCSYRKNVRTSKTVLLRVASAHEVPGTTTAVGREVHGNKEEVARRQGERRAGGSDGGREGEGRGVGSKGGREGASAGQREPARGRDGGQSLLWSFRTLLSAQTGQTQTFPNFSNYLKKDLTNSVSAGLGGPIAAARSVTPIVLRLTMA